MIKKKRLVYTRDKKLIFCLLADINFKIIDLK